MKTILIAAVVLLAQGAALQGYSQFRVGAGERVRWEPPRARWFATERGASGVSASEFQATLARAFETWEEVPTASIAFEFGGFTSAEPFEDDGLSVLGFQPHPEMERVLGAATFVLDIFSGEIVEADIFFNSAFNWSTAPAGDPAAFDLQSVALHEIGHFLGLGHSAIGETEMRDGGRRVIASGAVMFPIALGRGSIADRELQPDDIAGVSDLYPDGDFRAETGAVRGRVLRGGAGVLGAHVVAFSPSEGTLIGGFTTNSAGEFEIAGLPPGAQIIRVEPLDDVDVESIFSRAVDTDFLVTYYPRLFVAPEGGVGERIVVTVRPK